MKGTKKTKDTLETTLGVRLDSSILTEAEALVNKDRADDYGDIEDNFKSTACIAKACFGLDLEPADVAKVMIAVKLARQKNKHKRDNLVDLCGYAHILDVLEDATEDEHE